MWVGLQSYAYFFMHIHASIVVYAGILGWRMSLMFHFAYISGWLYRVETRHRCVTNRAVLVGAKTLIVYIGICTNRIACRYASTSQMYVATKNAPA